MNRFEIIYVTVALITAVIMFLQAHKDVKDLSKSFVVGYITGILWPITWLLVLIIIIQNVRNKR